MLLQHMLWPCVSQSVCHKLVLYQYGWTYHHAITVDVSPRTLVFYAKDLDEIPTGLCALPYQTMAMPMVLSDPSYLKWPPILCCIAALARCSHCYRRSSMVCRSDYNNQQPCKNGWTDRVVDSGGPKTTTSFVWFRYLLLYIAGELAHNSFCLLTPEN